MAINETGAIYKSLTYGGKTSREFGVYITGEGVYNAPERDVEMIDIPGRNGAYALDHGRFNNIEIEYPCSIAADNETDYREALSEFRNWLCSRKGYVRLTDDYNPDEYRLAVYKSGLEVATVQQTAGEFTITFEAKPQRFLTSGETAVTVQSGDTVNNPTLFDSSPLLEVWGSGTLNIGTAEIKVTNTDIGNIIVGRSDVVYGSDPVTQTLDINAVNVGDTITVDGHLARADITVSNYQITNISINTVTNGSAEQIAAQPRRFGILIGANSTTFIKGTAATYVTTVDYSFDWHGSSYSHTATLTTAYDGDETISYAITDTPTSTGITFTQTIINTANITAYSTKQTNGNPMYIDMDTGEAWNTDYGTLVSVNNAVTMPAKLPTLRPGANTITYDNTITQFKIIPRYWII